MSSLIEFRLKQTGYITCLSRFRDSSNKFRNLVCVLIQIQPTFDSCECEVPYGVIRWARRTKTARLELWVQEQSSSNCIPASVETSNGSCGDSLEDSSYLLNSVLPLLLSYSLAELWYKAGCCKLCAQDPDPELKVGLSHGSRNKKNLLLSSNNEDSHSLRKEVAPPLPLLSGLPRMQGFRKVHPCEVWSWLELTSSSAVVGFLHPVSERNMWNSHFQNWQSLAVKTEESESPCSVLISLPLTLALQMADDDNIQS